VVQILQEGCRADKATRIEKNSKVIDDNIQFT